MHHSFPHMIRSAPRFCAHHSGVCRKRGLFRRPRIRLSRHVPENYEKGRNSYFVDVSVLLCSLDQQKTLERSRCVLHTFTPRISSRLHTYPNLRRVLENSYVLFFILHRDSMDSRNVVILAFSPVSSVRCCWPPKYRNIYYT